MSDIKLYEISDMYRSAFEEFANNDVSVTEVPDDVWLDTLEALEGSVVDKSRNVVAYILELSAKSDMIAEHAQKMRGKQKTIDAKVEWLRNYLRTNMDKCGITKIEANDGTFTASISKPVASVVVDDVEKLPEEFKRIKVEVSADKVPLKKALEAGLETAGAHLEFNPRLTIK